MVDIVQLGGGQSSGTGGLIKDLLPVVLIAGLGFLAYTILTKPSIVDPQGTNNQRSQDNTYTQGSQNGNSNGSNPSGSQGLISLLNPAVGQVQPIIQTPARIEAGKYTVPGYPGVYTGTGIGNLFVTTGPGTPVNLFPLGNVITTSRDLNEAEQLKVLQNLLKSEIPNAWWSPTQTITQTSTPGGINSEGVYQSNIPVGTRHCKCPGPGCKPGDDWYYC